MGCIADEVGNRDEQECAARWRTMLDPAIKRGPWTQEVCLGCA
jgi:hypothetical protein